MSKYDPELYQERYRIKSNRIPGYDYSTPGDYFITICTQNMVECFGQVINNKMVLNKYGRIVKQNLLNTTKHFNNVLLDEYMVMPNHIHVIFTIVADLNERQHNRTRNRRDVACNVSTVNNHYAKISPRRGSLSVIVRSFKSACTKQIHELGYSDFAWQTNYYEHIIRNEKSLNRIREYIKNNPANWVGDRNKIY